MCKGSPSAKMTVFVCYGFGLIQENEVLDMKNEVSDMKSEELDMTKRKGI